MKFDLMFIMIDIYFNSSQDPLTKFKLETAAETQSLDISSNIMSLGGLWRPQR